MTGEVQSADYVALLEAVKDEIAASRVRAARAVNAELISMYWRIGALILERQAAQGWGARVVERLAADLRPVSPAPAGSVAGTCTTCGPSPRHGTRKCHSLWHNFPWGHLRVLLDRLEDHEVRQWYAIRDAAAGTAPRHRGPCRPRAGATSPAARTRPGRTTSLPLSRRAPPSMTTTWAQTPGLGTQATTVDRPATTGSRRRRRR